MCLGLAAFDYRAISNFVLRSFCQRFPSILSEYCTPPLLAPVGRLTGTCWWIFFGWTWFLHQMRNLVCSGKTHLQNIGQGLGWSLHFFQPTLQGIVFGQIRWLRPFWSRKWRGALHQRRKYCSFFILISFPWWSWFREWSCGASQPTGIGRARSSWKVWRWRQWTCRPSWRLLRHFFKTIINSLI